MKMRAMKLGKLFGGFFLMSISTVQAQPPRIEPARTLVTGIEQGTFPVSYRAIATYDLSRPPIPEQALLGKELRTFNDAPGRQMRVHLWYPAPSQGRPIKFEEYVWELAKDAAFGWEMTDEKKAWASQEFLGVFRDYFSNDSITLNQMKPLLQARMMAARDFNGAKGKFPVLIFPCWKPTIEASIMAEYLAHHGYVVASISLRGTDSNLPEISVRGITTQAQDIAFALGEVKKLEFADLDRIALMGTGINATSCMMVLGSHPEIKSYISLDGGILSAAEKQYLQQTTYYDPVQLTAPMLFMYAPHPSISPLFADDYKYARRTFIQFPHMTEHYFLNYAFYESWSPGIIGKPPGNVIEGNQWAAEVVRAYLDMTLGGGKDVELAPTLSDIPSSVGATYEVRAPLLPVPNFHQMKVLFSNASGDDFTKWYNVVKLENPRPYTSKFLGDLFQWLSFMRDSDFQKREALVKMWNESIPTSSRGFFAAARLAEAKKDMTAAKSNYKKAFELVDGDEDPFLDNIIRQRIKSISKLSLASN